MPMKAVELWSGGRQRPCFEADAGVDQDRDRRLSLKRAKVTRRNRSWGRRSSTPRGTGAGGDADRWRSRGRGRPAWSLSCLKVK